MRKIITFLGINPKETHYEFQGQVYTGQVFAEAMHQFLDFDEMLVFVTAQAKEKVYPLLEELDDDRISPIDIPLGTTTEEMWQIFDSLTSSVDQKDSVIFDITHAVRSLPFLVFLAAAFLKSAKSVTIEAVYYGALVLKGDKNTAPVIELSQFVSLLDWLNASEQFIQTGNAAGLAEQIRDARPAIRQGSGKTVREQSKQMSLAANSLEAVSRALRLILPDQAMGEIEKLQTTLGAATVPVAEYAPPFSVLVQKVLNAYTPLSLPNPRASENMVASLNRERTLIEWYLERNQIVQAVTIAREWLVSWGVVQAAYPNLYDRETRQKVEQAFGQANNQKRRQKGAFDDVVFPSEKRLKTLPDVNKVLRLYEQLGDARNTLLHAGKRPSPDPAETLEKKIRSLCQQLADLPLPVTEQGNGEV